MAEPEADIIICSLLTDRNWAGFDDNVHGACAGCGVGIRWRPHVPPNIRKLCMVCAFTDMGVQAAKGEKVELAMSRKAWVEVLRYIKTRK